MCLGDKIDAVDAYSSAGPGLVEFEDTVNAGEGMLGGSRRFSDGVASPRSSGGRGCCVERGSSATLRRGKYSPAS